MNATAEELKDLGTMRENVRRSVAALELCWSCQRVSDCQSAMVDDAAPVWLCADCLSKMLTEEKLGALLWPSPWPEEQ
jgi:hypothetical protein